MAERVEAVVVGAGVVGLAIARALARSGREVIILEAANAIGTETSSRNSEVIHAGIYYKPGSLQARLCVTGRKQLYTFCDEHGVHYQRCGKLIVATDENELPRLKGIQETAAANGLVGPDALQWVDAKVAIAMEPALHCTGALLSPATGIIDSHGLMLAYQGDAEEAGAMLALNSPVIGGELRHQGIRLQVGGESEMEIDCDILINAAGLGAQTVAGAIRGMPAQHVARLYMNKGCYYTLSGRSPFSRLIYPMPTSNWLGVHLTIDLGGQARFGPDAAYIDEKNYTVDPAGADSFYAAVRRYWPALPDGALQPGYAGIRPKLFGPGQPIVDFVIQGPATHGVPGLVNLFGIESPGLTSSLAIADEVMRRLAA